MISANLGYAILVALFFFRIPLFFDLAIGTCLGLALRPAAALSSGQEGTP